MEDSEGRAGLATDMTVNSKVGSGPSRRGDRSKVPPDFFLVQSGVFHGLDSARVFSGTVGMFSKALLSVCV